MSERYGTFYSGSCHGVEKDSSDIHESKKNP
jgi:hypothetical protein